MRNPFFHFLTLLPAAFSLSPQIPLYSPETSILTERETSLLHTLHLVLVNTDSVTGNEYNAAHLLNTTLSAMGYTVELQEVSLWRYNVFAYGKKRDTTILVTSHIDTVPPYIPYSYDRETDIVSGRGSVDAKGSVVPQIIAAYGLREGLQDDISLLFVVGEETGGDGMRSFSDWEQRPKEHEIVVFGEPTEGKLVCGHKGIVSFTVHVVGKAAHSGYPWLGVSANDIMVEALAQLLKLRENGLPWSEKYGNTTMNLGKITGGVAGNVVAETANASVAVRIAAGTPEIIKSLVLNALEDVTSSAEKQGGKVEVEWTSEGYPPVNIDCDIPGFDTMTVNYGTDVPNLKGGRKRYLYGPGSIFVAHGANEGLKRKELEQAVYDYRRLIVEASKVEHQERLDDERMEM